MDPLQLPASEQSLNRGKHSSYFDNEFKKDVISEQISSGTKWIPLFAVIGVSILMSVISVALPIQQHLATDNSDKEKIPNDLSETGRTWVSLLNMQVTMIQNLVHASLLGGAGFVAAFRGDAVWLFFARNCSFYFGLPAISYLVVDLFGMFNSDEDSIGPSLKFRIITTSFFVLFTSVAVGTMNRVCYATRQIVLENVKVLNEGKSELQTCQTTDRYPKTMAQTELQASKANIIYYGAKAVEIQSVAYTIAITALYLSNHECDSSGDRKLEAVMEEKGNSGGMMQLLPFEMSYSLGAHQSFLLSLFFLASTYPNCSASVGGTILGSGWRLTLAVCSIFHSLHGSDKRHAISFVFTAMEVVLMVPILFAAVSLLVNTYSKEYKQLSFNDDNETVITDIDSPESIEGENYSSTSCCFQCPSLWQISRSQVYTKEKRRGATILWISSVCLLVEMTIENAALLKESIWEWNATHHILKWGMHVASMYLFVCIMAVSSPEVYRRARFLLLIACPTGSGIATWQIITVLISDEKWNQELGTLLILVLFFIRALSGLGQFVGLFILSDTNIDPTHKDSGTSKVFEDDIAVRTDCLSKAKTSLWYVYMPSVVTYVVGLTLMGNGGLPMIPPTISSCVESESTFMFAPNWPGLGVFFHFGLLLVIFANDGIGDSLPSYRPSLFVAILFSGHIALLLVAELLFGVVLREDAKENGDWVRIALNVPWMAGSLHLCISLQRLWKHRVLPV